MAVLTTFIYGRLLRYGLWNKDKDEVDFPGGGGRKPCPNGKSRRRTDGECSSSVHLAVPILVALLLITFGVYPGAAGRSPP